MPYVRYMDMMVEASAPLPPAKYWEHHDCPWTPLRKPVAECNVAILGSAGVHMKSAPPFEGANDWSYRLVSSDTAVDDLTLSHPAPIAGPGREDLEVVFPLQRFRELEADGTIGCLADDHPSIIGTVKIYDKWAKETAPAIAKELLRQKVDLLCLFPL